MVVLQRLTWDLPSSASDFLTLLLSQLSPQLMSSSLVTPKMLKIIEKPAETFLMLASTEYKFHNIKPSIMVINKSEKCWTFYFTLSVTLQACAAILTSLEQIVVTVDDEIFQNLSDIVRISQVRQKAGLYILHLSFNLNCLEPSLPYCQWTPCPCQGMESSDRAPSSLPWTPSLPRAAWSKSESPSQAKIVRQSEFWVWLRFNGRCINGY